uniref:Uncharacterized protein n=1 Tax=Panagrolaimus superbus TaxID=310955 RepID=A0A914YLB8_9BILA
MDAQEALNYIPKAVQFLTFNTMCFADGNLVTTIGLLPVKTDLLYERLVLYGHRFPHRDTYGQFFNRIEALTNPGASVTLFTSNVPNDDVIAPMFEWGFIRTYLHRRIFGTIYETYQLIGTRRLLVGFALPNVPLIAPDDEDEDYPY